MLDKWWAHLYQKADGINLHTWAYMMYIHQSGISLPSPKYGTTKKPVHAPLHHVQNLAALLVKVCLTLASESHQQLACALLTQLLAIIVLSILRQGHTAIGSGSRPADLPQICS